MQNNSFAKNKEKVMAKKHNSALGILLLILSTSVHAGIFEKLGREFNRAVIDVGKTTEKAFQDTGKTVEKAAHDTGHTVEKAAQDTGKTIEKAAHDTGHTIEKAFQDTGNETERAGKNINEAAIASGHFLENQAQSVGTTLSDAEKRIRDGKIIDAIWHVATDSIKHTDDNFAEAVTESSLLNNVATAAASVYGGPKGAAAYAAWLTYT